MKILLDSCSFLWLILEPKKMSPKALATFKDPENSIYLSSITGWEISLKYSIGKLIIPTTPNVFISEQ